MAAYREFEPARILGVPRKLFFRVLAFMIAVGTITGSLFVDELAKEASGISSDLLDSPAFQAKSEQFTEAEARELLSTIEGINPELVPGLLFCPQFERIFDIADQANGLTGRDSLDWDWIVEDLDGDILDLSTGETTPRGLITAILNKERINNPMCMVDIVGTDPNCKKYHELAAIEQQYIEVIEIFRALKAGRHQRAEDLAADFDTAYRGTAYGCLPLTMPSMSELVAKIVEQEIGNKPTIAAQADKIVENVSDIIAPEKCPSDQRYKRDSGTCMTREEEIAFYVTQLGCTVGEAEHIIDIVDGQNVKTATDVEVLRKLGVVSCDGNEP